MGIFFIKLYREVIENIYRQKLKSKFSIEDWKEVGQRNKNDWN